MYGDRVISPGFHRVAHDKFYIKLNESTNAGNEPDTKVP